MEEARADIQRAKTLMINTWLDHFLLGTKHWIEFDFQEARREINAAMALKVYDYWSWIIWGLLHPDQEVWAMTICIGLHPNEAMAWDLRGTKTRVENPAAALADLSRFLPSLSASNTRKMSIPDSAARSTKASTTSSA